MARWDRRRRLSAPFHLRNYRALVNSMLIYSHPFDGVMRYVWGTGSYPWSARLRTPTGAVQLLVPHAHDVRTVNEVFCRRDYGNEAPRVVVDVGANIGVSAVYFLSRRADAVVYAWEPHPGNQPTLRHNLTPFGARAHIRVAALAPESGSATFVAEPIGRYSGLSEFMGPHPLAHEIVVRCEAIGAALRDVIRHEGHIDLLKIDTEGSERALLEAIPDDVWEHVEKVRYEVPGHVEVRTGADFLARAS